MPKKKPPSGNGNGHQVASLPYSPRELVVVSKADARLKATREGVSSEEPNYDASPLNAMLAEEGVQMTPLFGLSEERMRARVASMEAETGESMSDLSVFYHVEAPEERLDGLAERFQQIEAIEGAYVKPPSEPPVWVGDAAETVIEEMEPIGDGAPATPDFTASQTYLNAAPVGIDARHAWTLPGGRGAGVRVIDCEWGWNFAHEDLVKSSLGILVGTGSSNDNHGTAVVGEIGGDRNAFGVTGIAPDAQVGGAAFSMPSAQTIRLAADKLGPGDIILLEIHRAGPNATGAGQFGYIAVEWWPDDFAAIRYAVNKGIIVVEAAGNGSQNLDAAVYNTRPAGFPATWRNPFNPANPSSQAVVVGAGAPPPGTHGRNIHGPDRSRLGFSNYGRRVDCQGWGREVTSTGYGGLQGGPKNEWYTETFSGTSSASPHVVGALACAQGVLRAQGSTLLTPTRAISVLRSTGSPQQDAPSRPKTQRIGNRPDLRQLIPAVANVWRKNVRVIRTHAKTGSRQAWALFPGSAWVRIKSGTSDGVSNVFDILCEAMANNRRVDVLLQGGRITQATLR